MGMPKGLPQASLPTEICKRSGCVCKEGFARNGENCVLSEKCPNAQKSGEKCQKENEFWDENGVSCDSECSWSMPQCKEAKTPGCYCETGFNRNSNGDCKPESECCIGPNQEWSECAPTCHPT